MARSTPRLHTPCAPQPLPVKTFRLSSAIDMGRSGMSKFVNASSEHELCGRHGMMGRLALRARGNVTVEGGGVEGMAKNDLAVGESIGIVEASTRSKRGGAVNRIAHSPCRNPRPRRRPQHQQWPCLSPEGKWHAHAYDKVVGHPGVNPKGDFEPYVLADCVNRCYMSSIYTLGQNTWLDIGFRPGCPTILSFNRQGVVWNSEVFRF